MASADATTWFLAAFNGSKSILNTNSLYSKNLAKTEGIEISSDDDPRFARFVEGLEYTKRVMVMYHIILIIIVLLFAIKHWTTKIARAKGRRCLANVSTTSVAQDRNNVNTELDNESEPLLHKIRVNHPKLGLRRWIKSWLMYQPRPLPIINKDLPSNETSLVVIFLALVEIFFLSFGYRLNIDNIFLFGDRAASIFVANLPWLYILAAKTQPVRLLTGFSYESLNILHRRLGEMLCLLALFHICAELAVWYTIIYPTGGSFVEYLSEEIVILGLCTFICYETLYITSLRSFRSWFYELFLFSHVVLQFAALIFVYFHHSGSHIVVPIAMVIFVADSIVFRRFIKIRTVKAMLQVAEDGETVLMSAPVALKKLPVPSGLNSVIPLSLTYGRKTSQHVFFTVPKLGLTMHPFSIASSPPTHREGKDEVQLIIRAQNGFSRDLLEYSKVHDSAHVFLDGPYGSMEGLEMMLHRDINVVIAAGSGIAVAYPTCRTLADDLIASRDNKIHDGCTRKICLIWVIREQSNLSWIAMENVEQLRADGVDVIIPGPTAQYGRPNSTKLLEEVVRSRLEGSDHQSVGVFCSGPDPFNRSVRNATSHLASEGIDIDIAVEKYGW